MNCHCCRSPMNLARQVRIRPWRELDADRAPPGSDARDAYEEDMVYRWAAVCPACYSVLDNITGIANLGDRLFQMAGGSRAGQATALDEAGYRVFLEAESHKLGLSVDPIDTEEGGNILP